MTAWLVTLGIAAIVVAPLVVPPLRRALIATPLLRVFRKGMPPMSWNCYIRGADLDATVDAVKRNGGTIVMGPHQVPNDDRVAVAVDNQGAVISFVGKIIKSGTR